MVFLIDGRMAFVPSFQRAHVWSVLGLPVGIWNMTPVLRLKQVVKHAVMGLVANHDLEVLWNAFQIVVFLMEMVVLAVMALALILLQKNVATLAMTWILVLSMIVWSVFLGVMIVIVHVTLVLILKQVVKHVVMDWYAWQQ